MSNSPNVNNLFVLGLTRLVSVHSLSTHSSFLKPYLVLHQSIYVVKVNPDLYIVDHLVFFSLFSLYLFCFFRKKKKRSHASRLVLLVVFRSLERWSSSFASSSSSEAFFLSCVGRVVVFGLTHGIEAVVRHPRRMFFAFRRFSCSRLRLACVVVVRRAARRCLFSLGKPCGSSHYGFGHNRELPNGQLCFCFWGSHQPSPVDLGQQRKSCMCQPLFGSLSLVSFLAEHTRCGSCSPNQ